MAEIDKFANALETRKEKHTNEELKQLQSKSLNEKIAISLAKILEFNNKFPNKTYILLPRSLKIITINAKVHYTTIV